MVDQDTTSDGHDQSLKRPLDVENTIALPSSQSAIKEEGTGKAEPEPKRVKIDSVVATQPVAEAGSDTQTGAVASEENLITLGLDQRVKIKGMALVKVE